MTEEEAKTIICHKTIGLHEKGCIGSACTAWRWKRDGLTIGSSAHLTGTQMGWGPTQWGEPERPKYINDAWVWDAVRACWRLKEDEPVLGGYCGLAGRPE